MAATHKHPHHKKYSDFLCYGDYICLFCEEAEGYAFAQESGSSYNGIQIFAGQSRDKPDRICNPQVAVFQVTIQNRYKLNKKYNRLLKQADVKEADDLDFRSLLNNAKVVAEAENADNEAELRRQMGKPLRYGETIQLRHVFTNKYVHVCVNQTSRRDKNNMLISLYGGNAKQAQFRVLPRYKVKTEGEVVQYYDRLMFESVKAPNNYLHASDPWTVDPALMGVRQVPLLELESEKKEEYKVAELNLGARISSFTVIKNHSPDPKVSDFLRGGSFVRMFHKELGAYLVAEGLFGEELVEDVHLRVRKGDEFRPWTMLPSTSAITYWQVESEDSIINGHTVSWEQQVRFRHVITRRYLAVDSNLRITTVEDSYDPTSVFRLHPVLKDEEDIRFYSNGRIEHVISGYWLHAQKDDEYIKRGTISSLAGCPMEQVAPVPWDRASLRKLTLTKDWHYDDVFTIQETEPHLVDNSNFVAGMVPFITRFIRERSAGQLLNAKYCQDICNELTELKNFIYDKGQPKKVKQKLLRNFMVIDLLVKLLRFPHKDTPDLEYLEEVFKATYDVLRVYMMGRSRKNALYFAKYLDFFSNEIGNPGELSLKTAEMMVELVRDNRKIVESISQQDIDDIVRLLKGNKNYRYIDLLSVLCVCDGVVLTENQNYIVEALLRRGMGALYLTERGGRIGREPHVVFLSTDQGRSWLPVHEFVDKSQQLYSEEAALFYEHQLELFKSLCFGRNEYAIYVITRELGYLPWDEAFLCLKSEVIPDYLRARYCDLIICLFVDVGSCSNILEQTNLVYVYSEIAHDNFDSQHPSSAKQELITVFPVMREWIKDFLEDNQLMYASLIGRNKLIQQVLKLVGFLVMFGYYDDNDSIKRLLDHLLKLLDGKRDLPFSKEMEKGSSTKAVKELVATFRNQERFEPSPQTQAIVDAKCQAMQVVHMLLTHQFNNRMKTFIGLFRGAVEAVGDKSKKQAVLTQLLKDSFDATKTESADLRVQKKALKELREMFDRSAYFSVQDFTPIVLDLMEYKYDSMISASMMLLNKFYTSKASLFQTVAKAQLLIVPESIEVHREVAESLVMLRRLATAKVTAEYSRPSMDLLDKLAQFCRLPDDPEQPHTMNQHILLSHGILQVIFKMIETELDPGTKALRHTQLQSRTPSSQGAAAFGDSSDAASPRLMQALGSYPAGGARSPDSQYLDEEQMVGMEDLVTKGLVLLRALGKGNEKVQQSLFDKLDNFLNFETMDPEVALVLKEVFHNNQSLCLKVLPKHIERVVQIIGDYKEEAYVFLDLLHTLVKVEALDLTLKRNQAYVIKSVMENYSAVAYVLEKPRHELEEILTNRGDMGHLCYLVHLVDLMATCAEVRALLRQ